MSFVFFFFNDVVMIMPIGRKQEVGAVHGEDAYFLTI